MPTKAGTTDFEKALTRAEREHELVVFPKNKKLTHAFSVFEPFLPESSAVIDMRAESLRKKFTRFSKN